MDGRPDFAQSVALVIGIDAYESGVPPLRTAAADATRLAHLLRDDHGYRVRLLTDGAATREALLANLTEALPARVSPDDRVLFYFAGHGVALDGDGGPRGYLLPQDARRGEPATYLDMTVVHDALEALPCRHLLAILDSCFSGAFRWSATRDLLVMPDVVHQERYDRFILDPAWQALASAAHDQTALDALPATGDLGARGEGADGHSPFAHALFEALGGAADVIPAGAGDGVITATELYLYLEQAVQPTTMDAGHRQTPSLWPLAKHDKGEFIFLVPGHELNLPPAPPLTYELNPWRGLEAYDEADADLFFGRDEAVAELRRRVDARPLTAVLGASGTGKSSLVKAGLVPQLRAEGWRVLPAVRPGADPFYALAQAVAGLGPGERTAPTAEAVEGRVAAWLGAHPDERLALVVDQLEELVTLTRTPAERDAALGLLRRLADDHPDRLRLVLTLRSDFEPQFDRSALEGLWAEGRFVVPPFSQAELRAIIEQPASERVLYFKPHSLVDELVEEVIQTPGGLPLLSFALSEMYVHYVDRRSDDRAIERADYEGVGGVVGALRTRADAEYDALGEAGRETMRRVMLRMVAAEGGGIARRRVPREELVYPDPAETARVDDVVRRLTAARLVVEGRDDDGARYVEPAHDALVRAWDRLLGWIHAEQDRVADLRFQHTLARDARAWRHADDALRNGLLWRDSARGTVLDMLVAAEDDALDPAALPAVARLRRGLRSVRGTAGAEPTWMGRDELAFARRSIQRRVRIRLGIATLVALIAAGGVTAFIQSRIAAAQRDTANARYYATLAADALDRDPLEALVLARAAATTGDAPPGDVQSVLFAALQQPAVLAQWTVDGGRIWDLDVAPDGGRVLTLGVAGTVEVRDRTGQLLLATGPLGADVSVAALSPDGQRFALVDSVGALSVRAVDNGRELARAADAADAIELRWSPDGRRLLALLGREAVVWDAATGERLGAFGDPRLRVQSAAFGAGGRIVTHAAFGAAQVWSVADSALVFTIGDLPDGESGGGTMAVSGDGRVLALSRLGEGGATGIALWDVETADSLGPLFGFDERLAVEGLALSDNGGVVLASFGDGTRRTWQWGDGLESYVPGDLRRDPTGGTARVYASAAVLAPSGDRAVALDADGRARVWDPASSALLSTRALSVDARIVEVAFGPGGTVVTGAVDGAVRVWDPGARGVSATADLGAQPSISADGRYVFGSGEERVVWAVETTGPVPVAGVTRPPLGASQDGRRLVFQNTLTGAVVATVEGPDAPLRGVEFHPTEARAVVWFEGGRARLVDLAAGVATAPPASFPAQTRYAAFSPTGRFLIGQPEVDQATFTDLATGETVSTTALTGAGPVIGREAPILTFSPGDSLVALVDEGIQVIETATGRLRAALPEVEWGPVVFDPTGDRLLHIDFDDFAIRIWGWRNGQVLADYSGHIGLAGDTDGPVEARFSPDGSRVVSFDRGAGTAHVWSASTGRAIAVLGVGTPFAEVAFGPGDRLVTVGRDRVVRVYSFALADLLRLADARLAGVVDDDAVDAILDL